MGIVAARWFALAKGCVQCNDKGLIVGETPVLRRSALPGGGDAWTIRPIDDLDRDLSALSELPIEAVNKRAGFEAVAKALERGDVALAQIAALLLQFPDPPTLAKASGHDRVALAAELAQRASQRRLGPRQASANRNAAQPRLVCTKG